MSGKSQQRHVPRSKRKKSQPGSPSAAAPPLAAVHSEAPAAPPRAAAPAVKRTAAAKTPSGTVAYPYVTNELKRIGMLGGIMLVILVVLALVLS